MLTVDNAGNKIESISNGITVEEAEVPIEELLTAGKYVYYTDAKNITRECVVLYDKTSEYGIQIVTMETVENIELGNGNDNMSNEIENFNTAKEYYNDSISILNTKARTYLNKSIASDARSIGSIPDNPDFESNTYFNSTESYLSAYNGLFKDADNNKEEDEEQLEKLGIENIKTTYWFASRDILTGSTNTNFCMQRTGGLSILCAVNNGGTVTSFNNSFGLRPVFKLKENVKVTGGSGTPEDPYTLGV